MKIGFFVVFLWSSLFFVSCIDKTQVAREEKIPIDTIQKQVSDKHIHNIGETLQPGVKHSIQPWKEYTRFEELLMRYFAISSSEALSNAEELSGLAKELKDSIRISQLKIPAMKARLNVLNSECLRLKDMADIPAITDKEITEKVKDILAAFSATNAKINSIYTVNNLEKQLDLDPDFQAMIKKDSITSTKRNTFREPKDLRTKRKPQESGLKVFTSKKTQSKSKTHKFLMDEKLKKQLKNNKDLRLKRERLKKASTKK